MSGARESWRAPDGWGARLPRDEGHAAWMCHSAGYASLTLQILDGEMDEFGNAT
jgi:hypothetical protein